MSLFLNLFLSILCISFALALNKDWWKHSVIYEIYTPSFKDSNSDGWGDLKGITSKLDHFVDLGIDILWLTPFYSSPMLDTGYDVSNYLRINHLHGTMKDFNELLAEMRKRIYERKFAGKPSMVRKRHNTLLDDFIADLKLIIDFVPNHTSNQHKWFKKSVNRIEPYTDYYVWRDPKGYDEAGRPIEPNNWCNNLNYPSWTWNQKRKQFYYHAFLPQQPDLNHRNLHVKKEMKKIIKFWLNKGVAGIRVDDVVHLFEDEFFTDEEPRDPTKKGQKVSCSELNRQKTVNLNDSHAFVREIRSYVDELSAKMNTFQRIILLEVYGSKHHIRPYYGLENSPGGHLPLNYDMGLLWDYLSPNGLNFLINERTEITPNSTVNNWGISNHDLFRLPFLFIREYIHLLLATVTLLPGVTLLYYGEEIGMTAGVIKPHQRRTWKEYARTPMQWDDSLNGGFSSNKTTWLPTNPNSWRLNVKQEKSDPQSTYNFVKSLLKIKQSETMKFGDFQKYILSDWVFVFKRSYTSEKSFVVVLNMSTAREKIYLGLKMLQLQPVLKVRLASPNAGFKEGAIVINENRRSFIMEPMSVVVLHTPALQKEDN